MTPILTLRRRLDPAPGHPEQPATEPAARALPVARVTLGAVVAAVVVATLLAAVCVGSPTLTPAEAWAAWADPAAAEHVAVAELRVPRVALGAAVGVALALIGTLMQDALRNALAGPELTGAASAAALVLAVASITGAPAGAGARVAVATVAALVTGALVVALASRVADDRAVVVVGATVGAVLSAAGVAVVALGTSSSVQVLYTVLAGRLAGRTWADVPAGWFALAVAVLACLALARRVDAVRLGGTLAATIGARPALTRGVVLAVSSLVTAACVITCGPIPFVALAAPHLARATARRSATPAVLPLAGAIGLVLVVGGDLLARTVAAPTELPVGVATTLVGAPVLLVLLRRRPGGRR